MQQKNRMFWVFGLLLFLVADGVLALTVMVKHEPNFYRQGQLAPSPERKDLADTFLRNFLQMMANIKGSVEDWGCDATEAQLNSFFEEAFVQQGEAESLRKLGICSPRVALDGEHIRMAFRYGKGWFSTVISYELKIWLVPKEANVVAVQILSARAGAVPISCQSIVHQLTEVAREQNYRVTLYRHEGTPVAVIRLQEQANPVHTLSLLQFSTGSLSIRGKTLEHARPIVPGPVPKLAPAPLTP
jgi:hypothetical protein